MYIYIFIFIYDPPNSYSLFESLGNYQAESEEEKNSWMANLVMLNTNFKLERFLDVLLTKEGTKHPLRFPPSDKYQFSETDSSDNIVFEEKEKSSGVPLIKVFIHSFSMPRKTTSIIIIISRLMAVS